MAHARQRTLRHAPITEAVIDMRVSLGTPFTAEMLQNIRSQLVPFFPEVEEQRKVEAILQMMEGHFSHSASDQGVRRLVLKSIQRNEIVVASDEGFSFSKLRPYTNWDDAFAAAQRFWKIYSSTVDVERVQRIAVRYINHFPIPRTQQISDYLTAAPVLPELVAPENVNSALSRLAVRDPGSKIESTVIQITEPVESGTTVVIDIDCFRTGNFDPGSSEYWKLFEELRDTKNRIFFGSIHELAAEAFDR